ncbi:TetR/AcrR family transcriptional regulator [Gynuella sunshinyii]|uniref:Transcriptional regulator n=1 Tax=Gynuella sunshinyii YC6258 TaxID=1445510 RepID=A0A0C5VKN9_9GAMM|nr:TetR/AcrR family transcriptional regulator [Gynuella sunshinyii]AJQ93968.1 transcriptional regulator [Gynuella sunshinyii YC6258]
MKTGRPRQSEKTDARSALIAAAQELFLKHDFDHVSTRQIANLAGVNSALIAYYFGNKIGLFENAMKEMLAPVVTLLNETIQDPSPEFLKQLMLTVSRRIPADMARLIIRTLLSDNQLLKTLVVNELARPMNVRLRKVLTKLQNNNLIDPAEDPKLLSFLLAALLIFPLAMQPIGEEILDYPFNAENRERLAQAQITLLMHGVLNPAHS